MPTDSMNWQNFSSSSKMYLIYMKHILIAVLLSRVPHIEIEISNNFYIRILLYNQHISFSCEIKLCEASLCAIMYSL